MRAPRSRRRAQAVPQYNNEEPGRQGKIARRLITRVQIGCTCTLLSGTPAAPAASTDRTRFSIAALPSSDNESRIRLVLSATHSLQSMIPPLSMPQLAGSPSIRTPCSARSGSSGSVSVSSTRGEGDGAVAGNFDSPEACRRVR
jgi:hypothetical protein